VLWLRPEVAEWNPVTLNGEHAAFFLCVVIALAALLFSRRPVALWEIAVLGALGLMAFRSIRHTPLFCLATLAFVPAHLEDALERFQNSFGRLAGFCRRAVVQKVLTALLLLASPGILLAAFTFHKERAWTMEVPRSQYPVAAIAFITQNELRGNLLVFFDWGEQCLWELPDSRVSLDGRLDTSYPHRVIAAHWKFYNGEPYDKTALDVERADYALLRADLEGSLAFATGQPGWQAVYADELAVVLVRDVKQFPKLAGTHLPVSGAVDSAKGRAPFPNRPSLRLSK
jgi:hypothetical protein